jgi:DHA2 family multidrug resistance protein
MEGKDGFYEREIMVQNRKWILITLMLGTLMAALDSSIVNVSLPVMQRQFHCRLDDIQWVVTAYMLSFCVFMPLTNWLKNKLGFLHLYVISLVVFTAGSLCCGLSHTLEALILSRILQALGGGAINPTVLSIISNVFPKEERGSALGWWGIGSLLGPALGPTVGGILTQKFGWPSIFFVNIPVCVVAVLLSFRYLRFLTTASRTATRFDVRGFLGLSFFLVALQYAIARLERAGAGSLEVLGTFGVAIVSFTFFIYSERRKQDPLIDLTLFTNGIFVRCQLLNMVRAAALFGGLFLLPFLIQGLLGFSELQSGMLLLPGSAATAIITPLAGKWADRHGSRNILLLALSLMSSSMFAFAMIDTGASVWVLVSVVLLRGIGMGMMMTPLTTATVNSVRLEQVTMASSVNSLTQQLSGSLGIALLAIIHQDMLSSGKTRALGSSAAEHLALQRGFWVSAGLVALALIPAWGLPSQQPKPAAGVMPMPEQHAAHSEAKSADAHAALPA